MLKYCIEYHLLHLLTPTQRKESFEILFLRCVFAWILIGIFSIGRKKENIDNNDIYLGYVLIYGLTSQHKTDK